MFRMEHEHQVAHIQALEIEQVWWLMPGILAPERPGQNDHGSRLVWNALRLSQKLKA